MIGLKQELLKVLLCDTKNQVEHVETVFVGQGQIEKDKIRDALRKHLEGFVATRGGFDFEVFPTKRVLQRGQL